MALPLTAKGMFGRPERFGFNRIFPLQSKAKQPMPNNWRRLKLLLPLQFNDYRDVPPESLADAVLEIVDYFRCCQLRDTESRGTMAHPEVCFTVTRSLRSSWMFQITRKIASG